MHVLGVILLHKCGDYEGRGLVEVYDDPQPAPRIEITAIEALPAGRVVIEANVRPIDGVEDRSDDLQHLRPLPSEVASGALVEDHAPPVWISRLTPLACHPTRVGLLVDIRSGQVCEATKRVQKHAPAFLMGRRIRHVRTPKPPAAPGARHADPWRLNELVRRRRLREQARRPLAVNLAEGIALSEFLATFRGAARK